jgi:hypothetical protein
MCPATLPPAPAAASIADLAELARSIERARPAGN